MARSTDWRCLLATVGVLAVCGCARPSDRSPYYALTGTVESVQLEMGEVAVRTTPTRPGESERIVICTFGDDAETYVNDRLLNKSAIRVGDRIELLGQPEALPKSTRLNVNVAYVTRAEAPPPPPLSGRALTPPDESAGEKQPHGAGKRTIGGESR